MLQHRARCLQVGWDEKRGGGGHEVGLQSGGKQNPRGSCRMRLLRAESIVRRPRGSESYLASTAASGDGHDDHSGTPTKQTTSPLHSHDG